MLNNIKTKANPLPQMPKKLYNEFLQLLNVQSSSDNEKLIYFYLRNWLTLNGFESTTDAKGNLLVTKGILDEGESYPCVVSHIDTVHHIHSEFKLYYYADELDNNIILTAKSGTLQVGIGGDDKCGVYACLYALKTLKKVKVVFFTGEEIGCVGSNAINLNFFNDVGYIIQLDRWGAHDLICKQTGDFTVSDDFLKSLTEIMERYNYNQEVGLITDSITLFNRKVGVSCVNVSCGYYGHHSDEEIIDVNEFWNSLKFMSAMINKLGLKKYAKEKPVYTYTPKKGYSTYTTGYNKHYSAYDDDDYDSYKYKPYEYKAKPDVPEKTTNWEDSALSRIPNDVDWDILNDAIENMHCSYDAFYELPFNCTLAVSITNEYNRLKSLNSGIVD